MAAHKLGNWPGNFITPSATVPFQLDIARYPRPFDVSFILVTRFWHGNGEPTGGWQARRDLISRYTIPSVHAQTVPVDAWLVLVDEQSAAQAFGLDWPHRTRIIGMPPKGEPGSAITSGIRRGLADFHLKRRVIVARCDGDDAIAEDFVAGMVKYAAATGLNGPAWMSYSTGVQWDTLTQRANLDIRSEGHFLGLIQTSAERIIGPFATPHTEVFKATAYPTHTIATRQPMWCEVVHEHNAVNRLREGPALAGGWKDRFHL